MRELFEQHLGANLESYVEVKLTTVLTRLFNQPRLKPDVIKHSFKKWFYLSNNANGSQDDFVNIKDIEGYKMPLRFIFSKKKVVTMMTNFMKTLQNLNWTVILIISYYMHSSGYIKKEHHR